MSKSNRNSSNSLLIIICVIVGGYFLLVSRSGTTVGSTPVTQSSIRASATPTFDLALYVNQDNRCITYRDADAYVGQYTCVRGVVFRTFNDPNSTASFIDFDTSSTTFQGFSFRLSFDGLQGQCIIITGRIARYRSRTQIVINDRDQISFCK